MNNAVPIDPVNRFEFGKNWANFLTNLNSGRIIEAEKSLLSSLNLSSIKGLKFFDIGCGSGLFSLAAHRLGADVVSIDYDENSVNCATFLKSKYAPTAANWIIQQGSALNADFLHRFGTHDIVYSWGVLHHTGHMYQAFENVAGLVKDKGYLYFYL